MNPDSDERNIKAQIIKALIVDDEPLAREGIRHLLAESHAQAQIAEAVSGVAALTAIATFQPDLIFVDVQMPEMDGFELVRRIEAACMPVVVFVTAHDKYAIQAFEINAIDYLLKPVSRDRFLITLQRVKERLLNQGEGARQVLAMLQSIASPSKYIERVSIRTAGKTIFVHMRDIDWMQAAENYVQLHLKSARYMLHVPINTFQQSLDPRMFMRIHRSRIVNVGQIKELEAGAHGDFVLVLHSGARLQSSRTYHDSIRSWAANPF